LANHGGSEALEASYTVEGVKALQRVGGSSRRDAVAKAAESVGGRLERFYFAFGEQDAFVIADLPDNESAAALALAVSAAGGARVRTVVLLTAEEVDAAVKHSIDYRPPLEWAEPLTSDVARQGGVEPDYESVTTGVCSGR
jgi:uncharacterized protein with GYD domain